MQADPERIDDDIDFSLVRGGVLYHLQNKIGLIPPGQLAIGPRLLLLVGITWLPVVLLAAIDRRLLPDANVADPLLRHFGVHARCLIAIPMFLIAELAVDRYLPIAIRYFRVSGLVDDATLPRFREVLRRIERLRDSYRSLLLILALVVLGVGYGVLRPLEVHEVIWAVTGPSDRPYLELAGYWYLFVTRPIFVLLLMRWLWRVLLVGILFLRIGALDLRLVATHPDQAAGLGFLEVVPVLFAPVVFGMSAVVAATLGHEVLYHGTHVNTLYLPLGVFVAMIVAIFVAPLMFFSGNLRRLKRRALLQYGTLVAHHGRQVERRWIRGEPVEDEMLSAPELGPVADTISMYDAVARIRPTPFRRGPVMALAVAALLPMIPVLAIEVPLRDLLLKVLQSLV